MGYTPPKKRDRSYWANRANKLTYTEEEIVKFYEVNWLFKQTIPTNDEIVAQINKIFERKNYDYRMNYMTLAYHLNRKPVQRALTNRGIPWEQHSQTDLTQAQVAAAMVMMNFADTRSNELKLSELGVTSAQYFAWLDDPNFKALIDRLKDKNLEHIDATAVAELTKKINKGEWNAIKYYLDTTGTIKGNDTPQSEVLLKVMIEILQKHVKDGDILAAIANDIKLASANRTLEYVKPAIEGSVADDDPILESDEELIAAQKALGFG